MPKTIKNYYVWVGKGEGILPFYKEFIRRRKEYGQRNEQDHLLVDNNVLDYLKTNVNNTKSGQTIYEELTSAGIQLVLDKDVINGATDKSGPDLIKPIESTYNLLMELGLYAFASDCLRILYIQNSMHKDGDIVVFRGADLKTNGPITPGATESMVGGARFVRTTRTRRSHRSGTDPSLDSYQGFGRASKVGLGISGDLFLAEVGSRVAENAISVLSFGAKRLLEGSVYFGCGDDDIPFVDLPKLPENNTREAAVNSFAGEVMSGITKRVSTRTLKFISDIIDEKICAYEDRNYGFIATDSDSIGSQESPSLSDYSSLKDRMELRSSCLDLYSIVDPRELGVCSRQNVRSWAPENTRSNEDLDISDDNSDIESGSGNWSHFTFSQGRVERELENIRRARRDTALKYGLLKEIDHAESASINSTEPSGSMLAVDKVVSEAVNQKLPEPSSNINSLPTGSSPAQEWKSKEQQRRTPAKPSAPSGNGRTGRSATL